MTDEKRLNSEKLLGHGGAFEKKCTSRCKPIESVEEPAEVDKTSADFELTMDIAAKPAETAHMAERLSEIEESTAIASSIRTDASDVATPVEMPATIIGPDFESSAEMEAAGHREDAGVANEAAALSESQRLFLLTNGMNLNGILSSRMVAPRESFRKYYADLSELCPGWVPLLTVQPTAQLVERVMADRGAGAPVLVELSKSVLNGQAPNIPVTYVRAASLSDAVAIHFREEKSLREHRARGYSNVHPHEDLLRVSPELFSSPSDSGEVRIAPPELGAAVDWRQVDRVRGAVNGLLAAADSVTALAVAAGAFGAPQIPKGTFFRNWLTWDALTGHVRPPVDESEAALADRLIFSMAYRILGKRDQGASWSPSEVLNAVAGGIAATHPGPVTQSLIDRNLAHVQELVNVQRDFKPFRNPGSPYVAAKSLLMVLLRPDLGQLLDWPVEETGADPATRVVAAVLAGRLRGLARESVRLRNKALDDITASQAVKAANGVAGSPGTAEFVTSSAGMVLSLGGKELRKLSPHSGDFVSGHI